MAKDMYQKRAERKDKKLNNDDEALFHKTNINWDISTDVKPHSNPYEIRKTEK